MMKQAALLWCGAFAVIAFAVTLSWHAAARFLLIGVALLSVAEVLHAPSPAPLVDELGRDARGRYLAVFQYLFVVAELIGPMMFPALFDGAAALPFIGVTACCALATSALNQSMRLHIRTS